MLNIRAMSRILRSLACIAGVAVLSACASASLGGDISPSEIPRLETLRSQRPDDGAVAVRLGIAYRNAGQPELARVTLLEATELPNAPLVAWAHIGQLAEEAGDYAAAQEAYTTYLDGGGEESRDRVRGRLQAVRHMRLADAARRALAREAELSELDPDPSTIGVLPFAIEGPPQYEALGRGLAELLTTDLSITNRLSVLERARVQAMMDEMRLGLAGFTDPASAARTGRLLRAGTIVQGRALIAGQEGGRTRLQALLVDATEPGDVRDADQEGLLEQLIDMETALALAIYREMGIELTAAEVARIEDKPTTNLQAFLAYSEGLRALDEGDFQGAAARFRSATRLDPGFESASTAADDAEGASGEVAAAPPSGAPTGSSAETMADAAVPAGAGAATQTAQPTQPQSVSQGGEAENTETTAGTGVKQKRKVPIVFVRPQQRVVPASILRPVRPLIVRPVLVRPTVRR